jgi:hypothetical protein
VKPWTVVHSKVAAASLWGLGITLLLLFSFLVLVCVLSRLAGPGWPCTSFALWQ